MPSASRNANRKRRQRRKISLLSRALEQRMGQLSNHHFVLMALLHQLGGNVIVSQDSVAQVMQGFQHFRWKTEHLDGTMRIVLEDTRALRTEDTPVDEPATASPDRSVTAQLAHEHNTSEDTLSESDPARVE